MQHHSTSLAANRTRQNYNIKLLENFNFSKFSFFICQRLNSWVAADPASLAEFVTCAYHYAHIIKAKRLTFYGALHQFVTVTAPQSFQRVFT